MAYKIFILVAISLLAWFDWPDAFACGQQNQSSRRNQVQVESAKPNFVLINVDDADFDLFSESMLELYPNIRKIATGGMQFTNLHVTTPFCAPSRASLFRGQYAHQTGVRVNVPESALSLGFKGGYSEFLRQGHDRDELGVWMKQAGYRTIMIGKYHHNGFDYRRPPGWDDFYMSNGGSYTQTYRFTTQSDPAGKNVAPTSDIYRTEQETNDAVELIFRHRDRPFFLYVAPLAPHRPAGPDFTLMVDKQQYLDWMPKLGLADAPDLNETDISDKPVSRQSPLFTPEQMKIFDDEFRCRARAVKSVDDMVKRIFDALRESNQLDRTYVFFTSDNGYQLGHHRQHNKLDPYERCTRVPLFVYGPRVAAGKTANHLLAHFDIGATILELAGGKLPEFCQAKSFVPLLTNPELHDPRSWREFVVIENWQSKQNPFNPPLPGTYSGLRFYDQSYIEWATGEKSFYDLSRDPFQIANSYGELSAERKYELKQKLRFSRQENMNPIVTIASPTAVTGLPKQVAIRGAAEDDQVVKQVLLTIQDKNTRRFWNGKTWQPDPAEVVADQTADDQQMVFWSFPRPETVGSGDSPADYQVTAVAVDADGNRGEPAVSEF